MKRDFPLFLIDRSKHATYPFDFIVCFDAQLGFVAKVVPFFDDISFHEFAKRFSNDPDPETFNISYKFKKGGVFLCIEHYLFPVEWNNQNNSRIQSLLKKALKKFLHAEVDKLAVGDLGIENQIKQQESTIERAKQNYAQLVARSQGDKKHADYMIALSEATLESLKILRDNKLFINLN